MTSETTLRNRCRKLAKKLGCVIQTETNWHGGRGNRTTTYWVYGPEELYNYEDSPDHIPGTVRGWTPTPHVDPLEGNHACAGWGEVWEALQTYQNDLAFIRIGVPHGDKERILQHADPSLLEAWSSGPWNVDAALVLADYLEEKGLPDLAERMRQTLGREGYLSLTEYLNRKRN